MDLGLHGKRAIITGATRGIGRRVAELLADEGCDIAICARDGVAVQAAVEQLAARGVRACGEALNIREAEAYKAWLERAAERLGGVDIFIANVSAGGGADSEANWYRNFDIDLLGAVRGCEALMPHLRKSAAGAVVLMASALAVESFGAAEACNALKAALITYGKQLSQSVGKRGIRVNTVSPGPALFDGSVWEMQRVMAPKLHKAAVAQQPTRRLGSADEVANCVVFLASPAASWVSGVNLVVDGGFTKRVQL